MMKVPAAEIAARIVAFQALLGEGGIDVAVIRQNADLYYLTGTVQDAHLVVPARGEPVLTVRRDAERAQAESPIRPIVTMRSIRDVPRVVFDACSGRTPSRIGMELDVLPANVFFQYQRDLFPEQGILDVSPIVRRLRAIKSPWEIGMMREAGKISRIVAEEASRRIRAGVRELDLSAELEMVARKAGSLGHLRFRSFNLEMYFGHILAGPDAAVPSYADAPTGGPGISPAFGQGAGTRLIQEHEIVSVDTMVNHQGYINDQTRSFALGLPATELLEAYEAVKAIHVRMRREAVPGRVAGDLYDDVLRWVDEAGWKRHFMGRRENRITFVGHGVGLEVDEFPFIAKGQRLVLEEGMTFAFEPKIIIPGLGMAGLENTYLVTSEGLDALNVTDEDLKIL